MENKHKACFACIEVKQRCSFANRGGSSGPVPDAALSALGADINSNLEALDTDLEELRQAVLSAGLWQARAALHQANLMAMDLRWKVMEAESRGMVVPEGFRRAMDHGCARTRRLQLTTVANYAAASGVSQDSVNSTMGLVARWWSGGQEPEGSHKRARSGEEEEEDPEPAGKKKKKGNDGSGEEEEEGEETLGREK